MLYIYESIGTVEAFLAALGGERIDVTVKNPFFNDIESFYGILPDKKTAVIEMAAASGLTLVGDSMNPLLATTYGTGQLILDALDKSCSRIILGIGGSATNDGGIGIAASLLAFTKCSIKPGISIILDTVGFDRLIEDADLIITGEGRIDGQSLRGKTPLGIAARAEKFNVPVIAVVGSIGSNIDAVYSSGIKAVFSTGRRPVPFEEAKLTCREDLFLTVENIFRFYKTFREH